MKPFYLLAASFLLLAISANAQLRVDYDGKVYIQRDSLTGNASLTVGNSVSGMLPQNASSSKFGIRSFVNNTSIGNSVGLYSEARQQIQSNDYFSAGVWGIGGGAVAGRNYGVLAALHTGQTGAAIYATNTDNTYFKLGGNYSGYFYGPIYLEGQCYSTGGYFNVSDMRLKNKVVPMSDAEAIYGRTLDNIIGMEVLEYNLMSPRQKEAEKSGISDTLLGNPASDVRHFGLSAQELQKLYPNLVHEGDDGYLTVNYVELVPLLIRCIQELKVELDEVKGNGEIVRKMPSSTAITAKEATVMCRLYQNTPNPFRVKTEIRFSIPEDVKDAYIYIFDMTGKMLRQIPVAPSQQSVTINGYELSAGIYLYSLVVGGQEMDTKRMILSK